MKKILVAVAAVAVLAFASMAYAAPATSVVTENGNPDVSPSLTMLFNYGHDTAWNISTFNGVDTKSDNLGSNYIAPTLEFRAPLSNSLTFIASGTYIRGSHNLGFAGSDDMKAALNGRNDLFVVGGGFKIYFK